MARMDLGLTDRVYIVTGASRGLGAACARVLVEEGAKAVLCSRDETALRDAASAMHAEDRVMALPGDLAEPDVAERLVAAAVARFGRLDGALVSVGGPPAGAAMDVDDDAWRTAFEKVFLGALRVMRAVVRGLGDEGGSVALVLSSSVKQPIAGLAVSNGLRPGLAMTAKTLADELGPRGIRVNAVLPGRIDTDRVRELDAATGDADHAREVAQTSIPLRRYGQPEEFARAAVFLLSPAAGYITGTTLAVDGGALRTL
jgi:3-oxoacyl-[acyl-carrier protein] reductase